MNTKVVMSLIGALIIAGSLFAADGFIPLAEETWVAGLNGGFTSSRGAFENTLTLRDSKEFVHNDETEVRDFFINSYVGYFFIDNLATGIEVGLSDRDYKFNPDNDTHKQLNPVTGYSEEIFELDNDVFFIGPWVRYYIKVMDKDFAFYPEVSFGAMTARYRREVNDLTRSYHKYNLVGWGYNAGVGMAIILTPRFTLDIGGRYGGGQLTGEEERLPTGEVRSSSLVVKRNRFDATIGFNVLLGR